MLAAPVTPQRCRPPADISAAYQAPEDGFQAVFERLAAITRHWPILLRLSHRACAHNAYCAGIPSETRHFRAAQPNASSSFALGEPPRPPDVMATDFDLNIRRDCPKKDRRQQRFLRGEAYRKCSMQLWSRASFTRLYFDAECRHADITRWSLGLDPGRRRAPFRAVMKVVARAAYVVVGEVLRRGRVHRLRHYRACLSSHRGPTAGVALLHYRIPSLHRRALTGSYRHRLRTDKTPYPTTIPTGLRASMPLHRINLPLCPRPRGALYWREVGVALKQHDEVTVSSATPPAREDYLANRQLGSASNARYRHSGAQA